MLIKEVWPFIGNFALSIPFMKKILLIGAGRSSSALIKYLLETGLQKNWSITIGDVSVELAQEKCKGFSGARAIKFDVNDAAQREYEVQCSDLVISLLPPHLHHLVAVDCVKLKKHFLTASYLSEEILALDEEARHTGVLLLNECGLDPGIDHMSAMKVIDEIKSRGGELTSFKSYTGGLVAPESNDNPWGYKFSWNPRNVILAGQGTARYIQNGHYKYIPYNRIFTEIETIHTEEMGAFDGYANRDSLAYRHHYNIESIPTLLRGTLRQSGYCRAWDVFVKLGLTDDSYHLENSASLTYSQIVRSFLPKAYDNKELIESVAAFCGLPVDGEAMTRVKWTGIFEDVPTGIADASPAKVLQHLLEDKWRLMPADKDMIVMQHQFEFRMGADNHKIISSLIVKGDDQMYTAMAKTVGLPLGIAAALLLEGKINCTGVRIPVNREIYLPVLEELEKSGIVFTEKETRI